MQLEHDFEVPVPPSTAWRVLMDIEQVAPCMPGATLLSLDGDKFTGKVKVKVGPITVSYKGTAEFVERSESDLRAVIKANAREERGAGTASALVTARLVDTPTGGTRVHVVTDLDVTGKPAQFGRGVMEEVGGAIIGQFATRLARQIQAGELTGVDQDPTAQPETPEPGRPVSSTSSAAPAPTPAALSSGAVDHDDALDLGMLAWAPMLKRVAPLGAGIVVLALLVLSLRRPRPQPITVVLAQLPRD